MLLRVYSCGLPFRPLVKFVFLYFFKLGFLDGKAGFYYSTMQAFYEFMISVKLVELQQLQLTPSPLESVHKAA